MINLDFIAILRDNGLKITKGRISVLEALFNNGKGISADYIYEQCRKNGENFNLSTIYRTLEVFEEKGLIDKFDLGDGKYNYIMKENGHKHVLKCSLCLKEVEIDCPMTQIELMIKNKTGFLPMEHELKIKGICEQCKGSIREEKNSEGTNLKKKG